MKATSPLRARISRFFYERYRRREGTGYSAELILWGLIVILATWPMLSLVAAIETLK